MHDRLAAARLYGIVDLGYVPEEQVEAVTQELLTGGVGILQLRAKNYEESRVLEIARRLVPLCRENEVPFIVNDHIAVARECGADGVHLGQDDGVLAAARALLPSGAIVGRSTHHPDQARAALKEGADYIGFGPLFPTPTKEGRPAIGICDIADVQAEVGAEIPVFCIGGIKLENLSEVLAAGASRVVIVSGLLQANGIATRCHEVQAVLDATP